MEVLHLDYRPGTAGWGLRLQSRLQGSRSVVLRERYRCWKQAGLADLGIALATRLSLTLRVSARLGELIKTLRDEIAVSGQVDELLDRGAVYSPNDTRLFYDICVAIDAFYFELRSCYAVMGRFITTFGRHMLERTISEQEILTFSKAASVNTEWIEPVRENRKLFFHETAPWVALHILQRTPLECSILVMKENLHDFDDPHKYITQGHLVDTITGFQQSISAVYEWLDKQIREVEDRLV